MFGMPTPRFGSTAAHQRVRNADRDGFCKRITADLCSIDR